MQQSLHKRGKDHSLPMTFANRLASYLQLADDEDCEFMLNSLRGTMRVNIGKKTKRAKHEVRQIHLEGVLRMHGVEYEFKVDDEMGEGSLLSENAASLFDRSLGQFIEGDIPSRVYHSLLPEIEHEVKEMK